jgi:hypothetical protein
VEAMNHKLSDELMEHEFSMSLQDYITIDDVREELRLLANDMSSQKSLADRMNISPAYLCDVLEKRRDPGPAILHFLKLKKVIVYIEEKNHD